MKNKSVFYWGFFAGLLLISTACSKSKSYAEMVKEENNAISRFLEERGLTVVEEYPATLPFGEKVYFKTPEGLYMQVVKAGNPVDFAEDPDDVNVGYESYMYFKDSSDTIKVSAGILGTFQYNNPYSYYGHYILCEGMVLPLAKEYGLGDEAKVNLIIPSKLGTNEQQTAVYPIFYGGLQYTVGPSKRP